MLDNPISPLNNKTIWRIGKQEHLQQSKRDGDDTPLPQLRQLSHQLNCDTNGKGYPSHTVGMKNGFDY